MRRAVFMLTVIAVVGALMPAAALADGPEEKVYLSLGTSLAAGSQADELGNTTFSSSESYTDQLYRSFLKEGAEGLTHEKLGCPGETTDQFFGGVNLFGLPSVCAGLYVGGSQFSAAEAVIAEGNVALITIDIGINDATQTLTICQGDPACVAAAIPVIAGKVGEIVAALRGTGYTGPIVAMNYYNPLIAAAIGYFDGVPGQQAPDPAFAALSDALAQAFNGAIAQAYNAFGVPVADVFGAFHAGDFGDVRPANGIPDNVETACDLTYFCPSDPAAKPNTHANRLGYRVIASAFWPIVGDLDLTG